MEGALQKFSGLDLRQAHSQRSRVDFLAWLRDNGVTSLTDRQAIANGLGREKRMSVASKTPVTRPANIASDATVVVPGDPHLFFSPYNWAIRNGQAATASPGAYFRLAFSLIGGASSLYLELDSSAIDKAFMKLAISVDDATGTAVLVPPGEVSSLIPVLVDGGGTGVGNRHVLSVRVQSSVQSFDRWGTGSRPPKCSLRVKSIRLPAGATSLAPTLLPRQLAIFGDSITEGVSAGYQQSTSPQKGGDLTWNDSSASWAAVLAGRLGAEYGCVGFGRQGWITGGNGGVPCFHGSLTGGDGVRSRSGVPSGDGFSSGSGVAGGDGVSSGSGASGDGSASKIETQADISSWRWIYHGVPRRWRCSEQAHEPVHGSAGSSPPTALLVLHGTNDGLTGADAGAVAASVASFLADARRALGTQSSLILCVPFGGFGGAHTEPVGALRTGLALYQQRRQAAGGGADPQAHIVDLGPSAATNLSAFRIVNGRYAPSDESCDGIHPTAVRQRQLGEMLAAEVDALLAEGCGSGRDALEAS